MISICDANKSTPQGMLPSVSSTKTDFFSRAKIGAELGFSEGRGIVNGTTEGTLVGVDV